jgi:CO/xanthine dehydrogenase FAD-binding subunit
MFGRIPGTALGCELSALPLNQPGSKTGTGAERKNSPGPGQRGRPVNGERTVSLNKLQEYYLPEDSDSVAELLARHHGGAMIVAGGTFIHGLIARGLVTDVEALIDVSRLGLNYVTKERDQLKIGATTTFAQLDASQELSAQAFCGAVKDALAYPPTQVKNAATVGGCISASCPFFDLPVAMLALSGVVSAHGKGKVRDIPLSEFFPGLFENALGEQEFLSELKIPIPAGRSASAFIKLETNANDLAILNAAVWVSLDASGKCDAARVYVGGGVGEAPVRAVAAEAALQGATLTPERCAAAGQAARSDLDPLSDHRASAEYRKAMSAVLVERALTKTLNRLG